MRNLRRGILCLMAAFFAVHLSPVFSQASSTSHTSAAGNWLGWDNTGLDLDIEHRGNENILFRTSNGGIQGDIRMTIRGTSLSANTGFIGIGTNYVTPNQLLDVDGGDIDINTIVNGYMINNTHMLWHKGGIRNLFVGFQAGQTHAFNGSADNSFLGFQAGFSATGDPLNQRNTFLGSFAGFNDNSLDNTFIGFRAGFSQNGGLVGNTFVGSTSGENNTVGGENAFFGFESGGDNTDGDGNTFIGFLSGWGNTTGNSNTFLGAGSGGNNVSGNNNIAIGNGANTSPVSNLNNSGAIGGGCIVMNSNHLLVGNNLQRIGIGYSFDATGPQNSLDINALPLTSFSPGIAGGTSGLRFQHLRSASSTIANPGSGVLSVDANGNVIYVPANTGGGIACGDNGLSTEGPNANCIHLGQNWASGTGVGQLLNNREIPMNNNNLVFTDPALGSGTGTDNSIGIGTTTLPGAKLDIFRRLDVAPLVALPVGLRVVNSDVSTNGIGGDALGVISITNGNNGENYAGVFSASDACRNYGAFGFANYNISFACANQRSEGGHFEGQNSVLNIGVNGSGRNFVNTTPLISNYGGMFEAVSNFDDNINYGVQAFSLSAGGSGSSINYGGHFEAAYGDLNYGIYAIGPADGSTLTGGAGYFNGDVQNNGSMFYASDANLKKDIKTMQNATEILQQLNPVTYLFDTEKHPNVHLSGKKQWGLLSQEVEEILPELVKDMVVPATRDSMGNIIHEEVTIKGLNYTQLIPILVKGLQEQNAEMQAMQRKMDALENMISQCCQEGSAAPQNTIPSETQIDVVLSNPNVIILDENVPNPFAENTVIGFYIPENITSAKMVFTNKAGQVIKEVPISVRGRNSINVFGHDLSSGVYTYSLYINDQVYESKRMIKLD